MDNKKNDDLKQAVKIKRESKISILPYLVKSIHFTFSILSFSYPFLYKRCSKKLTHKQFTAILLLGGALFITMAILLYNLYGDWSYHHQSTWKEISARNHIQGTPMQHIPLDIVYQDLQREDYDFEPIHKIQRLMINTPGCRIPVAMINYSKQSKQDSKTDKQTCGKRAVELIRDFRDGRITIHFRDGLENGTKNVAFSYCCYRFIHRFIEPSQKFTAKYTSCTKVNDRSIIELQSDIINVQCFGVNQFNTTQLIYNDFYAFAKKIKTNVKSDYDTKYNVLIIGIDTMSLSRFAQTMPRTIKYLKDNFWLGFRGNQKVAYNTLPNLMAAFAGLNSSFVETHCKGNMDKCDKYIIWNKFKKLGYATAFAEDSLNSSDTFSRHFSFKTKPTDHHINPLFMKSERVLNNGALVCSGTISSGQQILDYAFDFATTYRSESFFGIFWINSFGYENLLAQKNGDKILEGFLNRLSYTGISKNTFLIIMSDHGVLFGDTKFKIESYYEQRLPCLFILPPGFFKGRFSEKYSAAVFNQFRLTNHYDLYKTLVDIHDLSNNTLTRFDENVACPKCHTLFEVINMNRTCQDAEIPDLWCTCHLLYPLDNSDVEGVKSVLHAVSYIQRMAKGIPTKRCWTCKQLTLHKILRIHFYYDYDNTKLYHLVAFSTMPSNMSFEIKVLSQSDGERLVIGPTYDQSLITRLERRSGFCTQRRNQRAYCYCQRTKYCGR